MKEELIEITGFKIGAKSWGEKIGRPVLCLHGMLDNAASFDLLAPLLPMHLLAVDFPGTGLSSHYPHGVLPHWKNDALIMMQVIKALKWESFDIIAHSLGALAGTMLAIALPNRVNKLVYLDVLGSTKDFTERVAEYRYRDFNAFWEQPKSLSKIYVDQEAAIKDRMQAGRISYQAAQALTLRGTRKSPEGICWTHDRRLRLISLTLPHEDELRSMLKALMQPVCLIRAQQGVPYDQKDFFERAHCIKDLVTIEIPGGHHVHMDDPKSVGDTIARFLR